MTPRARHVVFVTYNGLLEPLGMRQGLAYLEPLARDFRFTVLSYEKSTRAADPDGWERTEARLTESGIGWIPLPYHRRPSVPATLYDAWAGSRAITRLHGSQPVDLVHARGYVSAAVALGVRRRAGVPFLFDIRGLLADEYVDGRVWREGSLAWRLTRGAEASFLRNAAGVVTLTRAIVPEVERRMRAAGRAGQTPPWQVIPCCVDLDAFRPDADAREARRADLGVGGAPLVVYSGSVGTWYPVEPLVDFFAAFRGLRPDARLLLLLNGSDKPLRAALEARGIPRHAVQTVHAEPHEVPPYLAASDLGVAFIQPSPSKRASSPTKVAEYLACGLPVVLNGGVGDLDELRGEAPVHVADGLGAASLERAARAASGLVGMEPERAVAVASARFDLRAVGCARYRALYDAILPCLEPTRGLA